MKSEVASLGADVLPLQQGLTHGSYACDDQVSLILFKAAEKQGAIHVRAGIHYTGILAGCSCADDPTPNNETTEYCDVRITINCTTAETEVALIA